ncbi:MAG: 3-dehydroquinate synthase [Treponema sp.]|jgi:3-dehydroquinate synthase|nr:3-dehydroquinate synthase [Treponema sp.]
MLQFNFGEYTTRVFISREIPGLDKIAADVDPQPDSSELKSNLFFICDENTGYIADKICGSFIAPRCVLKSGEESKTWDSVELILEAARKASCGRDSYFIGVGGGVIGDLAGFAASIYMRGCRFMIVSTTLLGMTDASVGGKTGFNLSGIKNLAGSFYPARNVYMPLECLSTLPEKELKSGFAEMIKTAILDSDDFLEQLSIKNYLDHELPADLIERAVTYKGAIVSEDFRESGRRMLLNLGHTFAHALESAAGLGEISHGEAVAWGIARACELGVMLGITPAQRAEKIIKLIKSYGYIVSSPHPLVSDTEAFFNAIKSDKKKKNAKLTFIVPGTESAVPVTMETENDFKLLYKVLNVQKT